MICLKVRIPRSSIKSFVDAENFFASLHGLGQQVSLEVAKIDQKIEIFISCATGLMSSIKTCVYAYVPEAELELVDGAEEVFLDASLNLQLNKVSVYPIKRYIQFYDKGEEKWIDPCGGLFEAMISCQGPVVFQVNIKPLSEKFRRRLMDRSKLVFSNAFFKIDWFKKFIVRRLLSFPYNLILLLFSKLHVNSFLSEKTSLTHDKEDEEFAVLDKVSRHLFKVSMVIYLQKQDVSFFKGVFNPFSLAHFNGFRLRPRSRLPVPKMILNTEELATLFHFPVSENNYALDFLSARKFQISNKFSSGVVIGNSDYRDYDFPIKIAEEDRARHTYILGKTGMGKSTLMRNLIYQDLIAGNGVALLDPHGDLADFALAAVPSARKNDVIYVDPSVEDFVLGIDPLADVNSFVMVLKKMFSDSWGPRLEYILRYAVLTIAGSDNATVLALKRFFEDDVFAKKIVDGLDDLVLKNFWQKEFFSLELKVRREFTSSIVNKIGQFLAVPVVRRMLSRKQKVLDFQKILASKQVLIVKLAKGDIGEDVSTFLGSLIFSQMQAAVMRRGLESGLSPFSLYVDEFHNFTTDSFMTALSELRKYKLNLVLAHQYIDQLSLDMRAAVFGNIGNIICFQIGPVDAEVMAKQFGDEALAFDLMSLPKYRAYARILVSGSVSDIFSLKSLPPPKVSMDLLKLRDLKFWILKRFGVTSAVADAQIEKWLKKPV